MFKSTREILILFIVFLFSSTNNIISFGPAAGPTSRLTMGTDEMLQFWAADHVLGFRKGEMVIASGDHALRIEFVNARPVSPGEEIKSADTDNVRHVAQPLGKVAYRKLWDGVTLVYERSGSGVVKSTYLVEPPLTDIANPVEAIRVRYNVPVKVDPSGDLILSFATGEMRETRPVAWQEIEGRRVPVDVSYRLLSDQEVGFSLDACDPRYPLVIDPILSWNTFLGSSGDDYEGALALDGDGNVYIVGYSNASWGTPINAFAGVADAFAAKLNSSGVFQWNTFMGSTAFDYGIAIAVDGSGNVYVAGSSYATWGTPINDYHGGIDGFAAKLNSSGVLQWNTFMGSTFGDDSDYGIAVDGSGKVYVAGESNATWGIPINAYAAGGDAFAAKLNPNGARLWNTFMGSSYDDRGNAIAVDGSGNVYLAGNSFASWGTPFNAYAGGQDAFAAKLNSSGTIQWNTFMGSSYDDRGNAIAVDGSGNVYVAGESNATWGIPINAYAAGGDAFAAKLNPNGARLWHTFMGSLVADYGYGIAMDGSGNIYVAGESSATWGAPINAHAGGGDAFAAKFNPDSGARLWHTFMGSLVADRGHGIAVDGSGNVYVSGRSEATWGSPVNPYTNYGDVFVVKISSSITKNDFNLDGQEDILWRYNGSGGKNCIWYMKGATRIGSASLLAVTDLYWQIVGTGDFNGDGWLDILWRYNGSGGKNFIWYMKGATRIGSASLLAVTDLYWQIVGTGDFNRDGWPDILWRYNGSGGKNFIWYMKGATRIGSASLPGLIDLNWQIVGTGDFNRDGWPDILWRYNGSGGANLVWYMQGATRTGTASVLAVTDLNWKIGGAGDFNGDGWPDILWRYSGSGGKNCIWHMKGATRIGSANLLAVTDLNWRIENH